MGVRIPGDISGERWGSRYAKCLRFYCFVLICRIQVGVVENDRRHVHSHQSLKGARKRGYLTGVKSFPHQIRELIGEETLIIEQSLKFLR